MNDIKEWITIAVISIVLIAILLIQPAIEANTFNKFTGKNATYWDAMFSSLRVTGCDVQ